MLAVDSAAGAMRDLPADMPDSPEPAQALMPVGIMADIMAAPEAITAEGVITAVGVADIGAAVGAGEEATGAARGGPGGVSTVQPITDTRTTMDIRTMTTPIRITRTPTLLRTEMLLQRRLQPNATQP